MHKVLALLFILSLTPPLLAQKAKLKCAAKPPAAKSCTLQKNVTAGLTNEVAKIKEACEKEQFSDEYLETYKMLTKKNGTKSSLEELQQSVKSTASHLETLNSILKKMKKPEYKHEKALIKKIKYSELKIEAFTSTDKSQLAEIEKKNLEKLKSEYVEKYGEMGEFFYDSMADLKIEIEETKKFLSEYKKKEAAVSHVFSSQQDTEPNEALHNQALAAFIKAEVDEIKLRKSFTDCGLSPQEIHAIMLYTDEHYSRINRVLRSDPDGELTQLKPMIDAINSGLSKIRSHTQMVKRGAELPEEIRKMHCSGCLVTYDAYTSASTEYGFNASDKFVIKSKKGKYVAPLSANPQEEEVLFAPGAKFKILKIEKVPDGKQFTMSEQ